MNHGYQQYATRKEAETDGISVRYEIQAAAGQGSMSTVYKAIDQKTCQPVALKILSERTRERKLGSLFRFRHEATTMALCQGWPQRIG